MAEPVTQKQKSKFSTKYYRGWIIQQNLKFSACQKPEVPFSNQPRDCRCNLWSVKKKREKCFKCVAMQTAPLGLQKIPLCLYDHRMDKKDRLTPNTQICLLDVFFTTAQLLGEGKGLFCCQVKSQKNALVH